MTILPALLRVFAVALATSAARGFGRPSTLRCLRVSWRSGVTWRGTSGGGGDGAGDGADESELVDARDELDTESSGVSGSSSTCMSIGSAGAAVTGASGFARDDGVRDALLARFAAFCELSDWRDDADDSSNVRFGERYARASGLEMGASAAAGSTRGCVDGDGERDMGRGTWDGVRGAADSASRTADTFDLGLDAPCDSVGFALARKGGFFLAGEGGNGGGGRLTAGDSTTLGRPVWGPRKLRMDEKCSQS